MTKPDLLPCPFCGGEATREELQRVENYVYYTYGCSECDICLETEQDWNTRASGWVRVEDGELPYRRKVLVAYEWKPGHHIIDVGEWHDVYKWWVVNSDRCETVTHWQPLPPPPEES